MSTTERRLVKMFSALNAKERGVLVLQALKEEREEHPAVRLTMSHEQCREFNHYIFLMNTVNFELGTFLSYLQAMAQQMQIRFGWLQSLIMWSKVASGLTSYIRLFCREPVIQSEYDRLSEEERLKMVPVEEAAEWAADQYRGWTDADRDEDGDLTDEAWGRVEAEKTREITSLVETGVIAGRRKGRHLLVQVGSFYDWLGKPTPVYTEWGTAYEVLPDEKADVVRFHQAERQRVRELSERWTPQSLLSVPPRLLESYAADAEKQPPHPNWLRDALIDALINDIPQAWRLVRAVELLIEEVREEFDGEDPATVSVHNTLINTKLTLTEVRDGLRSDGVDVDLLEPDEDDLAVPRKIMERAERVYG